MMAEEIVTTGKCDMRAAGGLRRVAPVRQWHDSLSGAADHGTDVAAPVRRFQGIGPAISQPPLRESVLAIHLGGAKRVTRLRGRNREVRDVETGSVTVMPALEPNRWSTEGPVDFAHLTLSLGLLRQIAVEEFDREPRELQLVGVIGAQNATITACLQALLDDAARPSAGRLYRESLLMAISFNLVRHYSTLSATLPVAALGAQSGRPARGGLAGWQIRRVIDFMQANIAEDFSIDGGLIGLTGLSRAQFFRAFRQSTGASPHAFLTDLRLDQARQLLQATDLPVEAIARGVGLQRGQLAEAFRKRFDISPTGCRRARRRLP